MNDDWRLQVTLSDRVHALELAGLLEQGELEHELASSAGERVIVSSDDHTVFLYAGSRAAAEKAAAAVESLGTNLGWSAKTELRRWHPVAETWDDPEAPLPSDESGIAAEHAELIEREKAESAANGFSEYEVRIECSSHRDTVALAAKLRGEGISSVRRWRYLLVGAADEDSANALADRLTHEAPAGCNVTVEASLAAVAAETPGNPFAVFGGLGG
jgi:hypothetical protein